MLRSDCLGCPEQRPGLLEGGTFNSSVYLLGSADATQTTTSRSNGNRFDASQSRGLRAAGGVLGIHRQAGEVCRGPPARSRAEAPSRRSHSSPRLPVPGVCAGSRSCRTGERGAHGLVARSLPGPASIYGARWRLSEGDDGLMPPSWSWRAVPNSAHFKVPMSRMGLRSLRRADVRSTSRLLKATECWRRFSDIAHGRCVCLASDFWSRSSDRPDLPAAQTVGHRRRRGTPGTTRRSIRGPGPAAAPAAIRGRPSTWMYPAGSSCASPDACRRRASTRCPSPHAVASVSAHPRHRLCIRLGRAEIPPGGETRALLREPFTQQEIAMQRLQQELPMDVSPAGCECGKGAGP